MSKQRQYNHASTSIKTMPVDDICTFKENIIYAHFQTFPDKEGYQHPYAVSWAIDDSEVDMFEGKDTLDNFMNMLNELDKKKKFTLVFFGGSRLDIYFLYKWLVNNDVKVSKINSNGAFKKIMWRNIVTWDLSLHVGAKLDKACESFGVEINGKFDQEKIKSWSDVKKLRKEWLPFLKLEVVSMRELYLKYVVQMWETYQLNATNSLTAPSQSFKNWRTTLSEDADIQLLTYQQDCYCRKSVYGGRCYPVKQYFISKDLNENNQVDPSVPTLEQVMTSRTSER